jgi:colanic acid/amylovoran biosynthesis glycosyltransferase
MRVAVFCGSFPLVSETFVLKQITGLIDMGHEVDIYAELRPEGGNPLHEEVIDYGLLARTTYIDIPRESGYWELPVLPITGRTWPPGAETSILNVVRILKAAPKLFQCLIVAPRLTYKVLNSSDFGYQALSLSALYRLSALCAVSRNYDILHFHFGTIGNNFRFIKELWRAPFIVSFHGYDFSSWPRKQGLDIYSKLFDTVDAVTTNSEYTRMRVQELGCPPAKIHRLNMGLDLHHFQFHERVRKEGKPVRILTVARLVEKKGIEYAIRAVAEVRQTNAQLHYDIIGEGPLRHQLEALIQELEIQETVTLHGAQDSRNALQAMAQAHIFILPSVTAADGDQEGQGLVLQEAQAMGMPVVATNHNGFSESIVPNESGFLVPERDVDRLAERLNYLIEHPQMWPDMGRKGRQHVEKNYDIRKLNRHLVALYEQCIDGYRCGERKSAR